MDTREKRTICSGLVALAVGMGIGRFALTPLLPPMVDEGLLSVSSGGWLSTLHFAGYFVGALTAAGLNGDPRRLLLFAVSAIVVTTIAMGLSSDYLVWSVARIIAGVASAWILVVISRDLIHPAFMARPEVGQAQTFSGVGVGIAVTGVVCNLLFSSGVTSGSAWMILGISSGVMCLVVWLLVPESRYRHSIRETVSNAGRVPLNWQMMLAYGSAGLGYVIPATYLPLLAKDHVTEPELFGLVWPVFGLAACISTLIAFRFFAAFGNRPVWIAAQLIMAAGLILPVLMDGLAAIATSGLCVGGTFMVVTMAGVREAHAVAPPNDAGRHIAVLTAFFAMGQMVGPAAAAQAVQWTSSFSSPLIVGAVLLTVTAAGLLRHRRQP